MVNFICIIITVLALIAAVQAVLKNKRFKAQETQVEWWLSEYDRLWKLWDQAGEIDDLAARMSLADQMCTCINRSEKELKKLTELV